MRRSRIFVDSVDGAFSSGDEVKLAERNTHYLKNVLRVTPGVALRIFDGSGSEFEAEVIAVDKKTVSVRLLTALAIPENNPPLSIRLAVGVSKGERMDWVIQKATELGVTEIVPLMTQRVDVRLNAERRVKRASHWRSIAISASEQCGRRYLPQFAEIMSLPEFLSDEADEKGELGSGSLALVLDFAGETFSELSTLEQPSSVSVLVGPEGGLTNDELESAKSSGYRGVSLGPRVLRTETAPLVTLSILQHLWGDLR